MSDFEPKEDTNVTANGTVPSSDNGVGTISDKKDKDLRTEVDAVDEGKEQIEKKKDHDERVAVDIVHGGNESKEPENFDVKMTEAREAEKNDDDVKMTDDEDTNIAEANNTKIAETEDIKKEVAEGLRKEETDVTEEEKAKDTEKDEPEDTKEKEANDTEEKEAKDTSMEEAEDTEKKEPSETNNQKVEGVKKNEAFYMKILEAEDMKKIEVEDKKQADVENKKKEFKDIKIVEVDKVQDVEMEDRKEDGKSIAEDNEETLEATDDGNIEKKAEVSKTSGQAKGSKKKRSTGRITNEKREAKEKKDSDEKSKEEAKEKKNSDKKAKEEAKEEKNSGKKAKEEAKEKKESEKTAKMVSTPVVSSIERPVRERKSVERLVEALERESVKPFVIKKGRGTPLKDIPNVAYKLSKKKPAELKFLHQTLFGRVGKAIDYKNHILQFSGFVWHESEDKMKSKVKERLDKYVKDILLDFCDLFDIPILKAKSNARKEELAAMLLDFMVAPHATTDVILSEKEQQSTKSKKRKRGGKGIGSKNSSHSTKPSKKEDVNSKDSPSMKRKSAQDTEDEKEEDDEKGTSAEGDVPENSESKEKESETEEAAEDDKHKDDSRKGSEEMKSPKRGGSADTKKLKVSAETKRLSSPATTKSPTKLSSSKRAIAEDITNGGTKVFLKKHKEVEPPKKKTVSSRTDPKEKASGKIAKGKAKSKETGKSGPSDEELRKAIIEILNRVDFNTATFTDILKELASRYGMDLTSRKSSIKLMTQEELTKLAEQDDEDEDEEGNDK